MRVLALDLATNTGFARNYGPEPRTGSVNFQRKKKEPIGVMFTDLENWMITQGESDIVVLEKPHMRGGAATMYCVGLWAIAEKSAYSMEAKVMLVATRDLKLSFTGYGNASKEDMIAMAKRRGYDPKDDDEADACLLLEYALELKGLKGE
jgi:Holliday junction resolvasome RuvABC endonuclease subunit